MSARSETTQAALNALQTRAKDLASALSDASAALASDGRPVPTVLLAALERFEEERRSLAAELAVDGSASLTELRAAVDARTSSAALHARVLRVVATTPGYEAALSSLRASAEEAATRGPEVIAALERALAAAEGTAPITAVDLSEVRSRFHDTGLDDMLAIGLMAGHIVSDHAGEPVAAEECDASGDEPPAPEAEIEPAGDASAPPSPPDIEESLAPSAPPVPDEAPAAVEKPLAPTVADEAPAEVEEPLVPTVADEPPAGSEPAADSAGRSELAGETVAALLAAVEAGDLPLATWFARACEQLGEVPPLPASGLAALILADACGPGADDVAAEYEEEAVDALTSAHPDVASALVHAAAALRASLSLPYGNAPEVLRTMAPALPGALRELCEVVGERAPRGELLQPGQAASSARDAARREEQLAAVRQAAHERYQRANDSYYPSFPAAAAVWRRLVAQGEFGAILRATRDDEHPNDSTRALVERFANPREVQRAIDENFRAVRKSRDRIEASARDWIMRNAARALEPAREWIALSDEGASEHVAASRDGLPWLRQRLVALGDDVGCALGELTGADESSVAMAAQLFNARWHVLEDLVVRGRELPAAERDLSAAELLGAPLVRATELVVDADFAPASPSPEAFARALLDARRLTWEEALESRTGQHAHHLTRIALDHVEPERRERLDEQRAEELTRSRRAVAAHTADVRKRLDAALRDQVLTDAEHGQLVVRLQDVDPDREDLDAQRRVLSELTEDIEDAKAQRCRDLEQEVGNLPLDAGDAARVRALLDAGELAVAAEHLARYRAGDTGPELDVAPRLRPEEFATYSREHGESNLLELLNAQDAPERDLQALHILMKLASSTTVRDAPAANVLRILDSLGLEPARPELLERAANSMVVFSAPVRTGGVCPVPDFGSRSNGRYRVVLVGGRIAERDVVARVKALNPRTGGPVVLLTGDSLSLARRHAVAQQAIQEHVPFLLVDPVALAFVASEGSGSRAERFFAATLPFAWTNPYVTHGVVPPEMFFGRDAELHALLDAGGSAFIYGGRQLGKSALLMKALGEVHAPEEGRCAVYLDLDAKRIGHGASTDLVWSHLGAELARELPEGRPGSDEASVSRFMLEWLEEDDQRRLLVLLDETDHFLEKEADDVGEGRARMHNVIAMRDLMRQAGGRLKFVLAGLHSVQRFLHLPNQPLAHLGSPTPIGPLSWRHAARLVEEPMRALGYDFEAHVVDRVLTLTSRHPSLIQHVCRALVDHLSRRPRRELPHTISLRDLDEVYEDRDLRREIRNRFDWTLDLDPRYRVLAYTLAYESLEQRSVGSSRVDLQACKLEYSIVSPK